MPVRRLHTCKSLTNALHTGEDQEHPVEVGVEACARPLLSLSILSHIHGHAMPHIIGMPAVEHSYNHLI